MAREVKNYGLARDDAAGSSGSRLKDAASRFSALKTWQKVLVVLLALYILYLPAYCVRGGSEKADSSESPVAVSQSSDVASSDVRVEQETVEQSERERVEQEAAEREALEREQAEREAVEQSEREAAERAAAQEAEREVVAPAADTTVYVTEKGGKYHLRDCRHIADSEVSELSVGDAVTQGYEPCKVCNPPSA